MHSLLGNLKKEEEELNNKIQLGVSSKTLYRSLANIQNKIQIIENIEKIKSDIDESIVLLDSSQDQELQSMIQQEIDDFSNKLNDLQNELEKIFIEESVEYYESLLMEIRAGTGGDEASIFAFDLMNMYIKHAQMNNLKYEILDVVDNGVHGIRYGLIQFKSNGNTYEFFQFEAGVHRVQRIPATEANDRIHTSTATVSLLPEPEQNETIVINAKDLKVDTYKASGAGGQHVNKTESAIRILHVPSGIVVQCQTEKSQLQNRERCMKLLKAKLFDQMVTESRKKMDDTRRSHIGSGDRGEKSRTYNYQQNRITDHRFNISAYNLDIIMKTGNFNSLLQQLQDAYKKSLLNLNN